MRNYNRICGFISILLLASDLRILKPIPLMLLFSVFRSDDTSKALRAREPRQITLDDAAKTVSEIEHEKALKGLITVEGAVDVSAVSVSSDQKMLKNFRQ